MTQGQRIIEDCTAELHRALRQAEVVVSLTDRAPDIGIEDAYRISSEPLKRRRADFGTLGRVSARFG